MFHTRKGASESMNRQKSRNGQELDDKKENEAKKIIKEALQKCKNPYVAFSGGKDSTAMLHLVRSVK